MRKTATMFLRRPMSGREAGYTYAQYREIKVEEGEGSAEFTLSLEVTCLKFYMSTLVF